MFKKENRLVPGIRFNNSHLVTGPQFTLKEKANGLTVNRFGIVVSKKIDKKAVGRNKIKRTFRTELVNLNKKMNSGHDMIFIVKKGILDKTKGEILLEIKNSLGKLGLIKK